MLRRRTGVLVAALAVLAMPVAVAQAAKLPPEVQSVVDDFRSDGAITPCKHTVQALEETSKLQPSDVAQVSPDFPPAVAAALEERKHDDCGDDKGNAAAGAAAAAPSATASPAAGASPSATAAPSASPSGTATPNRSPTATATPTGPAPPAATPAPTPAPTQPALTTVAHDDSVPLGLWILIGLLVFAALLWLALFALGRLGWGDERLAGSRHAWAEARYRAGGVWSDFTDWLRLGR